jgi:hypothetical protein
MLTKFHNVYQSSILGPRKKTQKLLLDTFIKFLPSQVPQCLESVTQLIISCSIRMLVAKPVKKFTTLTETADSLQCSQTLDTGLFAESVYIKAHTVPNFSYKVHFNIILPYATLPSHSAAKVALSQFLLIQPPQEYCVTQAS